MIPGTTDTAYATLTNAAGAVVETDVPGNNKSEQVSIVAEGNKLTVKPKWATAPDESKEPGLEVTFSGIQVRPAEGEKRLTSFTVNQTIKVYGGVPLGEPPTAVAVNAGNGQVGMAGMQLAEPVSVIVTDRFGDPVQGVDVGFAATLGGGSVGAATVSTDANGVAETTWTLGTTASQQVVATVTDLTPVTFSATLAVDDTSVASQSAYAGDAYDTSLVVELLNASGGAIAGQTVTFTVTDATNGGTLDSGTDPAAAEVTAVTNAFGLATVDWTSSAVTGTYTVEATIGNLTTVTFTGETVNPLIVENVNPAGPINDSTSTDVTILLQNADGTPRNGETVQFAADAGDATVSDGVSTAQTITSTTDGNGNITVTWTVGAGNAGGSEVLTIDVPGDGAIDPLTVTMDINLL